MGQAGGRRALGLDGCPAGWAAVLLVDGAVAATAVVATAAEALQRLGPDAVGVDMPIGLVDGADRAADVAARRALRPGGASVFNAPARSVVTAWQEGRIRSYADAVAVSRAAAGKGLSQQSWRLVAKIAEIDAVASSAAVPVLEVHPEVCFRELAGAPLAPKRSWNGLAARHRLLRDVGVDLPDQAHDGHRCAADDLLDAAAVAWTAAGLLAGEKLLRYPPVTVQIARGRPIEIVARRARTR
jgi:predicted RNase H-like nuclease